MDAYSVSSIHYSSPSQTYSGAVGNGASVPTTAVSRSATVKKRTPRASIDGGASAGPAQSGGVVATASAALNSIGGVGARHMSPLNPRRGKDTAGGTGSGGGGGGVGVSIGGAVASMNPNVNSVGVRSTSPVQAGRRRLLGVGRRAGQS